MPSHVEHRAAQAAIARPREYSRRQLLALQRPANAPPADNDYQSRDPFLREVRIVDHQGTPIQLVSILSVDLDSPVVWHGSVGFMQAHGIDADYHLPFSTWTVELEQEALRELNRMMRLPREIEKFWQRPRGQKRPTHLHRMIALDQDERDKLRLLSLSTTPLIQVRDPRKLEGDD